MKLLVIYGLASVALVTSAASTLHGPLQTAIFGQDPIEVPTLIAFGPLHGLEPSLEEAHAVARRLGFTLEITDSAPDWIRTGTRSARAVYVPTDVSSGYIAFAPGRGAEFVPNRKSQIQFAMHLRIVMLDPWVRYYLRFWPVVAAIVLIAASSLTHAVESKVTWYTLSLVIVTAELAVYVPMQLALAANPLHNVITRDLVAIVALAVVLPAFTSGVSNYLWRRHLRTPLRIAAVTIPPMVVLAASPLLLLMVHCTSGDCL